MSGRVSGWGWPLAAGDVIDKTTADVVDMRVGALLASDILATT